MAQSNSTVVRLDANGRRQREELRRLLVEARQALVVAEAGDLELVYTAHLAINRAVGLMLRYRWDAA